MYANREHICPDCGVKHRRRGPAAPPMRCHPCSIKHAAEVSRQMYAKQGPYWDRYRWALAKAARRMAADSSPERARRAS